jgi:hypothetical protein
VIESNIIILKFFSELIITPEEETIFFSNKGDKFLEEDLDNDVDKVKDYLNENDAENDVNDGIKRHTFRDKTIHTIKNIIKNKIEENSIHTENIFNFLQPEKFSYGRNMYPHVLRELESTVKYKTKKEI